MSYSFTVNAPSKAEAKKQITDQFANIVTGQPMHAVDRDAAVACGHAFVDALVEPQENSEVVVAMYGSVGWRDTAAKEFTSASVSVNASVRFKD